MARLSYRYVNNERDTHTMPSSKKTPYELVPQLGKLRDEVLFGDVWEQPELTKRDRSLITIAALTALYRPNELEIHIGRGLDNGLSREEICELIMHMAIYGGFPVAVEGMAVAKSVFEARSDD